MSPPPQARWGTEEDGLALLPGMALSKGTGSHRLPLGPRIRAECFWRGSSSRLPGAPALALSLETIPQADIVGAVI